MDDAKRALVGMVREGNGREDRESRKRGRDG